MDEKIVHFHSSWKISEKNSLGTDFDSLANVQVKLNDEEVDAGSFLDVVDMDHYLFFESPRENEERCVISINVLKGSFSSLSLVTDARNIEIFIADSGKVTSYWKTFRGKVIDELSELGSETYLHEICFDCKARYVELKLGKTCDANLYLFGLKILVNPSNDSKQELLPSNNINFQHVESMLSSSSVPLTAGAERALSFLKNSGGAFRQNTPPTLDTVMNVINAPSMPSSEVMLVKSYLDVRLKEMEEKIVKDFDDKLKAFEERQNQKLNEIIQLLRK